MRSSYPFMGTFLFSLIILCCGEDESGSGRNLYGNISKDEIKQRGHLVEMMNDRDNYGPNGASVDTVIVSRLVSDEDGRTLSWPIDNSDGLFFIDTMDLAVLSDGGIYFYNSRLDSSSIDRLFLSGPDNNESPYPGMDMNILNEDGSISYYRRCDRVLRVDLDQGEVALRFGFSGIEPLLVEFSY